MGRKEAGKGGRGEKHCTVEFAGKRYLWFPLKSSLNRVSWILAGRDSGEGKYLNPFREFHALLCHLQAVCLCLWVCVFYLQGERERSLALYLHTEAFTDSLGRQGDRCVCVWDFFCGGRDGIFGMEYCWIFFKVHTQSLTGPHKTSYTQSANRWKHHTLYPTNTEKKIYCLVSLSLDW